MRASGTPEHLAPCSPGFPVRWDCPTLEALEPWGRGSHLYQTHAEGACCTKTLDSGRSCLGSQAEGRTPEKTRRLCVQGVAAQGTCSHRPGAIGRLPAFPGFCPSTIKEHILPRQGHTWAVARVHQ